MFNMVKEQETENVSTREGSIPARLHSRGRPVVINCPDGLEEVGISAPDWKKLNLDYLTSTQDGAGAQRILRHDNGVSVNNINSVQFVPPLDYINVLSLNVCGIKSKFLSMDFVNFIKDYNVICLCETKCDDADMINVKNMEKYWL